MPNGVTYSDESTINKVYTALAGNGEMSFPEALVIVNRLQNAGILFREQAEERKIGPRNKTEETLQEASENNLPTVDETAADSKHIEDINARIDQVSQGSAQTSIVE